MSKQRSFRLRDSEDHDLAARLDAVAKRGAQGDMIRLALWRLLLPSVNLPPSLIETAAHFAVASRDPVEQSPVVQQLADSLDELAAISARLADIAERPAQVAQPAQPHTFPEPHAIGGEVQSGGVDMTRERPRTANHPKAEPGPDTQH